MAFLSKVGSVLRQTATTHVNNELSASRPSLYQAIRWMSSSKLFVGGVSYATDDTSLREAFSKYGEVVEARIILDRETGRSRGFGFVTYTSSEEASSAIQALDGQDLHGRRIRVNYATDRARGSFGGGYGGGGYGAGGYGASGGGYGAGGGSYGAGGGYGASGGGYNNNYGAGSPSGSSSYAGGNALDAAFGSGGGDVAGGSDNFGSSNTGGGFDGNPGLGFGGGESGTLDDGAGGYDQDEPLEGNFKDDDDDAGDFAKRV